jgi:ATP phosphoribosyltransferase
VIKLALPTGDLRAPTAELLSGVGLQVEGYGEGSRLYRLPVAGSEEVRVRVFRERDIPMQVALGNYDIGITSLSWIVEMQARFPQQPIAQLGDLRVGGSSLFAAESGDRAGGQLVRIASEYPNVAEAYARSMRFPRYRVQAVAGAAEAYPPEDADIVVLPAADEEAVRAHNLQPLHHLLKTSAYLIGNVDSLMEKDLSAVLGPLRQAVVAPTNGTLRLPLPEATAPSAQRNGSAGDRPLRLAIPDGHQQRHVYGALAKAGIFFEGYEEKTYVRRPKSNISGLEVKVIRPQDMPQLIAFGEFDIAITGRDLLLEHTFAFPSTPAVEVLDLQVSQYNLSAVVDGALPADNIADAMSHWRQQGRAFLTVAAEFPATADHYARSRHFWRYRVMPIAGASEGFVPEDADILIEGTETGRTIAENNLKVLDNIFRSTTCLIARSDAEFAGQRRETYNELFSALRKSVS